jgi:hypothetical protein
MNHDMNELRAEFDKFVRDKCSIDPEGQPTQDVGDAEDEEPVPAFVDELADKLLAPIHSGVYLSRLDIKRVAEGIDESLPIKERKKMIKALFRHTVKRDYLRKAFDEFNKHLNGRILIYKELGEAFPASKPVFDGYTKKIEKTMKMFDQMVEDFEEIDPTVEPMPI